MTERDRSDEDTDEHPAVSLPADPAPQHHPPPPPQQPTPPQQPPTSWQPAQGSPPPWQPPQEAQTPWRPAPGLAPGTPWRPAPGPAPVPPPWQAPAHAKPPASSWPGWAGPQPSPWAQQQAYWTPGPRYGSSSLVIVAAVLMLVIGVLALLAFGIAFALFDAVVSVAGEFVGDSATVGAVRAVLGGFVVASLVQLVAGVGVLAHRQWARWLGLVVATPATLLGTVLMVAAATTSRSLDLVVTGLLLGSYALITFGLIAGGSHFRRRY